FTTVGTFNCDGCKGSGTNSVTFGGGGDNSLTLSFAGEAATLSDLSLGYVFASFGKFQVSAAGSGGMIPPGTTFTLTITQTAPSFSGLPFLRALTGTVDYNANSGFIIFNVTRVNFWNLTYDILYNPVPVLQPTANGNISIIT